MNSVIANWKNWAIAVLTIMILILLKDCSPQEKTETTIRDVKVKIPESTGVFSHPDKQTELPSKGKDSVLIQNKYIYSTNPIDKEIAAELEKAKDSLSIIKILMKGAQVRENITDFSNDKLALKIYTRTVGKLDSIAADFKIKEQEVRVQEKTITKTIIKKDGFGIPIGGGVNKNLDNTKLNYEFNAGIRVNRFYFIGSVTTDKTIGGKILIEL